MSMQPINNFKPGDLDSITLNKFDMILTNEEIHKTYPDFRKFDLLEGLLVFSSNEIPDEDNMSKETLLKSFTTLKKEHIDLISLYNEADKERKALKAQNFKLIEKLFTFENYQIDKFDHDFNGFLSRMIFLNYELSKKFLEIERENNEKLQKVISAKDEELASFKSKVALLEQRVIEGRKMLKKTILEPEPSGSNFLAVNENTNNTSSVGNRQGLNSRDSPSKISASGSNPEKQNPPDATMKVFVNDLTKNLNSYHKKGLNQLVSPNNLEASMSDKILSIDNERLSANLTHLDDKFFEEVDLTHNIPGGGRSPPKSDKPKTQDSSFVKASNKTIKDTKEAKPIIRAMNSRQNNTTPNPMKTSQPLPRTTSTAAQQQQNITPNNKTSNPTTIKKEMIKSSSQKSLTFTPKFEFKGGEEIHKVRENERSALSIYDDQNISMDSIHFPTGVLSDNGLKIMDNGRSKANLKDILGHGNGSKMDTLSIKKSPNTTISNNKSLNDSKTKTNMPNITINTSPIIVKKKRGAEPK